MIKTVEGAYIAPRTIERIYTRYDSNDVMLGLYVESRGGKQTDCIVRVNTYELVGGEAYIARQLEKLLEEVG